MTMPWPSTFPAPQADPYELQEQQSSIRTDMDSGSPRMRRRFTAAGDDFVLSWMLTESQVNQFRAYFDYEIQAGTTWVTIPVRDGRSAGSVSREVRFVSPPKYTRLSVNNWRVTAPAELRALTPNIFSHLNLFTLPSLDLDFSGTKSLSPVITSAMQPNPAVSFTRSTVATYFDVAGVLQTAGINAPRFDHDPVTHVCKGLLIEESRTNYCTYSEQFDNAAWSKVGITVTADQGTALTGATSADLLTLTATGDAYVKNSATLTGTACHSIFVKQGGANPSARACLRLITFATVTEDDPLYFDFSTKTFSGNTSTVLAYGYQDCGGGIYRIWASNAEAAGQTGVELRVRPDDAGVAVVGQTMLAWGAQIESGAFPTSYIPTTSAAVTRSADVLSMTGSNFSSWYRHDEGTFYVEADSYSISYPSGQPRPTVTVSKVSGAAGHMELKVPRPSGVVGVTVLDDTGATAADISSATTISANTKIKAAFAYKQADFALSDRGALFTSTSGNAPSGIDRLGIGHDFGGALFQNGHIARLAYHPQRLSNAQLQALTA